MRTTSGLGRAVLLLGAGTGAVAMAACDGILGTNGFEESPCYPLPASSCTDSSVNSDDASGDGSPDAGFDSSVSDVVISDTGTRDTAAADSGADSGADALTDTGITPADGEAGCPAGNLACDGGCVPDDPRNCGTCGHDCTSLANVKGQVACGAGGACEFDAGACAPGYAHCGSGGPDQGCETPIDTTSNCGACGATCGASAPKCAGSGSAYSCVSGCPASDPTPCGMTCVDTTTDTKNCNGCGNGCTTQVGHATATCVNSACGYSCNGGYTACNGGCADYSSDSANCGSCGNKCPGGQVCSGGSCACPAGTVDCAGTCEAPGPQNGCGAGGACGMACPGPTAGTGSASCNGTQCALSCAAPTPDPCGTACVDTSSNGNNCGSCGHDCLGGSCTGGMCQPVTLASTPLTAYGYYIAIDASNVYWAAGASILACSKSGGCGAGTPVYTASGLEFTGLASPTSSSAYQNDLYAMAWGGPGASNSTVFLSQIAKSSGSETQVSVATTAPQSVAFDSVGSWVYVLDYESFVGSPAIERMKPDGSQFTRFLASGINPDGNLAIDSQNVYVGDTVNNRVVSCPLSGNTCSLSTVMNVAQPYKVYSDGTNVWVATEGSTGTISRCGVGSNCGGSPTTIASAQASPTSIVADANYAYWANLGQGGHSQIMRCAVAGCGGMPTVLANVAYPYSITADATALYWGDNDGIKKLAK